MSNAVRILFVARSTTAHHLAGGMERGYEDIAWSLHNAGHEISLLTTQGIESAELLPPYAQIWQLSGGRAGRYSPSWWVNTYLHEASWSLWKPDVIFSVSSAAGSICLRRTAADKIVAQCHGTALAEVQSSLSTLGLKEILKLPLNALRILREIPSYRGFAKVIAIGPLVHKQLTSPPLKISPSKVTTINNGVDELKWAFDIALRRAVRSRLAIPPHATVGLFAARLHAQKGADIAIRSLAHLPTASEGHLIICGDGPERPRLETLASSMGLDARVHFLGKLPQETMSEAMSAADLFVFPTRRQEGLPLNILEALANGLPLVTVPNANVPAEFTPYALIVDGQPESVAKAWSQTDLSPDRSSKLSPEFTQRGSAASYLETIVSFVSRGRSSK